MMQILIDIPEEKYNYVKNQVAEGIDNPLKVYIANGTPLPADWQQSVKTGWIPCSERMPDRGDTYLVSGVQEINGEMVPFVDAANYPDSYIDGLWGTFTDWIEGNEVHVLAWQEMPEAWEGCDE